MGAALRPGPEMNKLTNFKIRLIINYCSLKVWLSNLKLGWDAFRCILKGGSVAVRIEVHGSGNPGYLRLPFTPVLCANNKIYGTGEGFAISIPYGPLETLAADQKELLHYELEDNSKGPL